MALWLLGFLSINVVLEGLEVFSMLYEAEESWAIVSRLITEKIGLSYFGIQFVLGALLPLIVLGGVEIVNLGANEKTMIRVLTSVLVLIGVFAMRWNVVIGGQLMSKSLRGFTSYYPPLFGLEGILSATALTLLPFVILAIIVYLLPPWQEEAIKVPERRKFSF
jgi:predicted membrane protein